MDKSLRGPYWILTSLSFAWCAGIIAAPLLQNAGMNTVAGVLYEAYGKVCHRQSVRSFFCAGQQFGVCIRCTSIYFSFFAAVIAFPFAVRWKRRRTDRLPVSMLEMIPSRIVAMLCFLPMLLDVGLSTAGISFSTTVTRVVSGMIFGLMLPWYVVPVFLDACGRLHFKTIKKEEKKR